MPLVDRLRPLSLLALLGIVGCGEAAYVEKTYPERRFGAGVPAVFFVIANETPPPGFKPSLVESGPALSLRPEKEEANGVVTLAVEKFWTSEDRHRDRVGPRIEHVDDSAPIISVGGEIVSPDGEHLYLVPIVGPKGERLSQGYRIKVGVEPTLKPVGSVLPRVHRQTVRWAGLYVEGPEPDLILTVSTDLVVSTPPPGALGGKPVANYFLIRWAGERGEGWSLATSTDAKQIKDPGPVWKTAREARLSEGSVVIAEKIDGSGCDVHVVDSTSIIASQKTTAAICDDALLEMEGRMSKARIAKAIADEKDTAEREKKAADIRAMQKRAEAERAERTRKEEEVRKKEAPIIAEYNAAIQKNDLAKACSVASAHFDSERHAQHALTRWGEGGLPQELKCALDRQQKPNIQATLEWAYERATRDAEARYKAQQENAPRERKTGVWSSWGTGGSSSSSTSSHQDYMNRVNDYLYGSGKASSCPFDNKTYCR